MTTKINVSLIERALAYEFAGREQTRWRMAASLKLDKQDQPVITQDATALAVLEWIDRIARRISSGEEMPFAESQTRYGVSYSLTRLGDELRRLSAHLDKDFFDRCTWPVFNPYIEALLSALRKHWGMLSDISGPTDPFWRLPWQRSSMHQLVQQVRATMRSEDFKNRVNNFDRASIADFQKGCGRLLQLFQHHSKLLIVRVDLYFSAKCKPWGETIDAEKAYARLVRHLREGSILPNVLGWFVRREMGFVRGVHYHLMVVMDGHRYRDGYGYAMKIGRNWIDCCAGTGKAGAFFNCFDRRREYQNDGLGLVHVSDVSKLIGLREAMEYITKAYFKVRSQIESRKSFRTSQAKDEPARRGAPRKPEHDMSAATRILGKVKRSNPRYLMAAHKAARQQLNIKRPYESNRFLAALVEELRRATEPTSAPKRRRRASPARQQLSDVAQYPIRFG